MMRRLLFSIFLAVFGTFFLGQSIVEAYGVVPCGGQGEPPCQACYLVQLGQNVVTTTIGILVGIMVLIFIYAGIKVVMAGGSTSGLSEGKKMMTNAIVGFVIILSSWLIIDTALKVFVSGDIDESAQFLGRPWNKVECVKPVVYDPYARSDFQSETPVLINRTGNFNADIAAASEAFYGRSTANAPNTQGGRRACAWAVNQVLVAAGVTKIGNLNVREMERLLIGGRGTRVSQSNALPGDIVIEAGGSHVGICRDAGCTRVLSNSSSRASYVWESNISFRPSYTSGQGRIYRVVN